MGNPELLLLDEPTEGLAPLIVKMLYDLLIKIKADGLTILLSEQNLRFSIKIGSRAYIIDDGRIQYEGSMQELATNTEIMRKYLAV
jgi:branched-chain amino acid transport system ATP-binding protein